MEKLYFSSVIDDVDWTNSYHSLKANLCLHFCENTIIRMWTHGARFRSQRHGDQCLSLVKCLGRSSPVIEILLAGDKSLLSENEVDLVRRNDKQ
jgi:hypothetical protein